MDVASRRPLDHDVPGDASRRIEERHEHSCREPYPTRCRVILFNAMGGMDMKPAIIGLVGTLVVAGCNTVSYSGPGLEPIPGSITYSGQPRTKLTKSPVGSAFPHDFIDQYGQQVEETYIIQPDRSLMIAHRRYKPIRFFGD
jgi:hypothetical protein